MDKKRIEEIAAKYQATAEKKYNDYQQSGVQRYMREYERADEIVDICNLALGAADDHQKVGVLRSQIAYWGSKAVHLVRHPDDDEIMALIRDVKATAVAYGLTTDPYTDK